jgi:tetratricopeptide (TPR) repeat protein
MTSVKPPPWHSLGYANHHIGDHARAIECFGRTLDLVRDTGDRYNEAYTLSHLGDTHHAAGAPAIARDAWRQALDIFTDLGHPDAVSVRAKLEKVDAAGRDHGFEPEHSGDRA